MSMMLAAFTLLFGPGLGNHVKSQPRPTLPVSIEHLATIPVTLQLESKQTRIADQDDPDDTEQEPGTQQPSEPQEPEDLSGSNFGLPHSPASRICLR